MKTLITGLALIFCLNAAATFESAEKLWGVCSATVREEAQARVDELVRQSSNPTIKGELGSTYDIRVAKESVVESTTFYTLTWIVAAEGMPKNYSYGELKIKAEATDTGCKIVH